MGSFRGTSVMPAAHGIQRFEGWHIIHGISRDVSLPPTIMVTREGVVDISEDVLDGGPDVKAMGEAPTAGIVVILVVVVHGDGDGDGKRTRSEVGCL